MHLRAQFSQIRRKEEDPVSLHDETRRHSEGDGKGETKGKRTPRELSVRKVAQAGVLPFSTSGNAKRNPHVSIGTHQNAHTTNPKVVANERIKCVFMHTGTSTRW